MICLIKSPGSPSHENIIYNCNAYHRHVLYNVRDNDLLKELF